MKDAISLLGHTALMIYDNEYIVNQRVGLIRANNDIDIEYPYFTPMYKPFTHLRVSQQEQIRSQPA